MDDIEEGGPLHWRESTLITVHFIFIISMVIIFLITVFYPAISYETWGTSDVEYNSNGRAELVISNKGPGTLYVRAYCTHLYYSPDSGEYDQGDTVSTTVSLSFTLYEKEIQSSKSFVWDKFDMPEKGTYHLKAVNNDGLKIHISARYIAEFSGLSCCTSCLVIPIISITYILYMVNITRRRGKLEMEAEYGKNRSLDYYTERWKDPGLDRTDDYNVK